MDVAGLAGGPSPGDFPAPVADVSDYVDASAECGRIGAPTSIPEISPYSILETHAASSAWVSPAVVRIFASWCPRTYASRRRRAAVLPTTFLVLSAKGEPRGL